MSPKSAPPQLMAIELAVRRCQRIVTSNVKDFARFADLIEIATLA